MTMTTSFFDTTTNLWSDAFLARRGGYFNYDDYTTKKMMGYFDDDYDGNNDHKYSFWRYPRNQVVFNSCLRLSVSLLCASICISQW